MNKEAKQYLKDNPYITTEEVEDYINTFDEFNSEHFEEYRTGTVDFYKYAKDLADDILIMDDTVKKYFNYDNFAEDLKEDYIEGENGYWFRR